MIVVLVIDMVKRLKVRRAFSARLWRSAALPARWQPAWPLATSANRVPDVVPRADDAVDAATAKAEN